HEPSVFLSDVQITRNFATADSVLAIGEQPKSGKPLIQSDGGIFANTSNLDRELTLRVMFRALPSAALCVEADLIGATAGADHAVRPAPNCKVLNAVVRIGKVNDCFLKALWFAHGIALHKPNYSLKQRASQVNNCPF